MSTQRFSLLSDRQLLDVHAACDQFEQALDGDQSCEIEAVLECAPEDIRDALLDELILIEFEWRLRRNEPVTADEYVTRFPDKSHHIMQSLAGVRQYVARLSSAAKAASVPRAIGRFQVVSELGRGAFGIVYQAQDDQLQRTVAIKVPHPHLVSRTADAAAYLAEARTVASLEHPHIVPVYDVGSSPEFPCFIVSKFIEGVSLAQTPIPDRRSFLDIAAWIESIADTLHYAHQHGIVHRDVKPSNILLDGRGNVYLVDFGLALLDDNLGQGPRYIGTAAYMSPEQARGEGHRVDGRSDVFSLGVVLYELLAGSRPFRGTSDAETMQRVATFEPQPLRQIDERIPLELERICLKAMAKLANDRYDSALDMAQDLRHAIASIAAHQCDGSPNSDVVELYARRSAASIVSHSSDAIHHLRIVPKGLRPFDEHDADFFVDLLPGIRGGDGLPESIRFWKTRIEASDSDTTFSVGLLYGPSGCGKSSLVKAGLLPRLSPHILPICMDATADRTESDLLRAIRKRCAWAPPAATLQQTMAALRRTSDQSKVVIVIDQFEQWLHARAESGSEAGDELTQALRQCDGGHVQCLLLTRDDFWMSITRFMRDLDVPLSEGRNARAVDLFPKHHALRVLRALGRAYGTLPGGTQELSPDQCLFLEQAVSGLAQQDKVICVHLALFAQMVRDKVWSPATLSELGGMTGVGVEFLNETFVSVNAPLANRYHRDAATALLGELLPEIGSDLKGHSRSSESLQIASGYATEQNEFDDLIHLLDHELHLITPCDRGDVESEVAATSRQPWQGTRTYYQLAHDYLVPSLREWLMRQQSKTRRGRAEIRLKERAELWSAKREKAFLPSLFEFIDLRLMTRKARWTAGERRMMAAASRRHGTFWGSLLLIGVVAGCLLQQAMIRVRRDSQSSLTVMALDGLEVARGSNLATAIEKLNELPRHVVCAQLQERFASTDDLDRRIALGCALARYDRVNIDFLSFAIEQASEREFENLRVALTRDREMALERIRTEYASSARDAHWRRAARFATVALYMDDPALAWDLCRVGDTPEARAVFVDEFSRWHGDTSQLTKFALARDHCDWISFLCLAIGGIAPEEAGKNARELWGPLFADWFLNAPDRGTHGAARWALRQWQLPLPHVPEGVVSSDAEREWLTNSVGMTMILVPSGTFTRRDNTHHPDRGEQQVTISNSFWLASHEVSRATFGEFLEDPLGHEATASHAWESTVPDYISPTADHPMNACSWYDAVVFCNWLSRREGRTPAYHKTGEEEAIDRRGFEAWWWDRAADGYRLPTEAEWELACRAGMSTNYFSGDTTTLLDRFATFSAASLTVRGAKLPNAWGFFDLCGNAGEWCYDWSGPYPEASALVDPIGVEQSQMRIMRGGAYLDPPTRCGVGSRNRSGPWGRGEFSGFRVARNLDD